MPYPVESSRVRIKNSSNSNIEGRMESTVKEMTGGESVLDMDPKSTVGGGVEDVYGEDRATEDQLVTPWTYSVTSGYSLLRDPHHNKGLAFTETEGFSLLAWFTASRCCHSTASGENFDGQYPEISSSIAEVYGHDGSSGKE